MSTIWFRSLRQLSVCNYCTGSFRSNIFKKSFSSPLTSFNYKRMSSTSRPKVFVTRSDIPPVVLQLLQQKCEVSLWPEPCPVPRDFLLSHVKGMDGLYCLITDKIDEELLDAAGPQLKVVGTMSVGVDHVNVPLVKSRGVKLGYTPNVLTDATAETTVALLLATSRRIFEAHQELTGGGWAKSSWGPLYLCGQGLSDSTVGIFGLGRIGQAVLERLRPFRVGKFLYSCRTPKPEVQDAEFVSLETLCSTCDFIIVTCALTSETKGIFNERLFRLMKPNAIFVNTSRGGVVDQDALVKALKENWIWAAGLDVMTPEPIPLDHELIKLPNCTLLPHIGSATVQSRTAMAMLTAQNIIAAIEGKPMPAEL